MKYAAYENYKNSASEWLGSVPSHWYVDRLKWSTTGCYNGVWGDEPNDLDDLVCIRVADFDRDRFIVVSNPPTIRAIEPDQRCNRILQKNDLLIEKSGGGEKQLVGCVVQFTEDFPAVCSNFVARLPVARDCDSRYWAYLHSAVYAARLNYLAIKQTTGIQNLDSGEYLNILAVYPPLEEQQTIARFLDAKTAQIDALVAKKRQLIDKLKEKRSALIARTVTRGLPPEAAKAAGLEPHPEMKDSGVEWLGQIPTHWIAMRAKYLCLAVVDCKNRTPDYFDDGGYLVVRTTDVRDGVITFEGMHRTDEQNFHIWTERGPPQAGDVIFTREAPAGEAAIFDGSVQMCLGQRMMYFRVNPKQLSSRYLLHWLYGAAAKGYIASMSGGSTVTHLRVGQVHDFPIATPPISEQLVIADYLDDQSSILNGLMERAESAITRLTEYRQALITSAVTGKIDVRGWV